MWSKPNFIAVISILAQWFMKKHGTSAGFFLNRCGRLIKLGPALPITEEKER